MALTDVDGGLTADHLRAERIKLLDAQGREVLHSQLAHGLRGGLRRARFGVSHVYHESVLSSVTKSSRGATMHIQEAHPHTALAWVHFTFANLPFHVHDSRAQM